MNHLYANDKLSGGWKNARMAFNSPKTYPAPIQLIFQLNRASEKKSTRVAGQIENVWAKHTSCTN